MTKNKNLNPLQVELAHVFESAVAGLSEVQVNEVVKAVTSEGSARETLLNDLKKCLLKHCLGDDNSIKIWDDLLTLRLNVFGLSDQSVTKYCSKVEIEPSKLYFKLNDENVKATSVVSFLAQELELVFPKKYVLNVVMPNLYSVELVG